MSTHICIPAGNPAGWEVEDEKREEQERSWRRAQGPASVRAGGPWEGVWALFTERSHPQAVLGREVTQ